MFDYTPTDISNYTNNKSEIVYYHTRGASSSDETSSEGMTNKSSACWMISVIQALRSSSVFREEFMPKKGENNTLKKELFLLFDIGEGKNGQKRRKLKAEEVQDYQRLLIKNGLKVKMDRGYHEEPFLRFLLDKIGAKSIEYRYGSSNKKKSEKLLTLAVKDSSDESSIQSLIDDRKITFSKSSPKFLPIFLDRPVKKGSGASRAKVVPSETISVSKTKYKLIAMVVGRDSSEHVYTYVPEVTKKKKAVWVEYNDEKVVIHESPKTKKRTKGGVHTPYDDACKHATILIYEAL